MNFEIKSYGSLGTLISSDTQQYWVLYIDCPCDSCTGYYTIDLIDKNFETEEEAIEYAKGILED